MGLLHDLIWSRGATSGGGGGGDTEQWETLYEGEVTTTKESQEAPFAFGELDVMPTADTIKVTLNGVEYTCEKIDNDGDTAYGGITVDGADFSEYPFIIMEGALITESAGTYSLKIEEPNQSSANDFSTAKVTISASESVVTVYYLAAIIDDELKAFYAEGGITDKIYDVPLYKGEFVADVGENPVISGNAEYSNNKLVIRGNCTLKGYTAQ